MVQKDPNSIDDQWCLSSTLCGDYLLVFVHPLFMRNASMVLCLGLPFSHSPLPAPCISAALTETCLIKVYMDLHKSWLLKSDEIGRPRRNCIPKIMIAQDNKKRHVTKKKRWWKKSMDSHRPTCPWTSFRNWRSISEMVAILDAIFIFYLNVHQIPGLTQKSVWFWPFKLP